MQDFRPELPVLQLNFRTGIEVETRASKKGTLNQSECP
jgi:hypothetical protein